VISAKIGTNVVNACLQQFIDVEVDRVPTEEVEEEKPPADEDEEEEIGNQNISL